METTTISRSVGAAIGAALFAIGLFAFAPITGAAQDPGQTQTQDARRGPGGPGGRGGRFGGPMAGGFGMVGDLTDAQREQVRAIREKHAGAIQPLMERVRTSREAVHAAIVAGKTGALQSLAIEVGNAETELTFARAQVETEIYALLTPQQKQQLAERRQQMDTRRAEMIKRRQERQQ
jgi:Spy/CpxP family protein refolding chaperone